jgi:hypothetical protein
MAPRRSARHAGQHANTDYSSNLVNSGINEVTVPDNAAIHAPGEEILSTQPDRALRASRTATDAATTHNKREADRALSETDQDGDSIPAEGAQVRSLIPFVILILFMAIFTDALSSSYTHSKKKKIYKLRYQYLFLAC